jgi:hypothetical protein
MNKFLVFPCIKKNEIDGYSGPLVTLANENNISFSLFFPISEENANLINYILETPPNKHSLNDVGVIGMCKTMISSWGAGERFLSGIHMDTEYDLESEQDIITIRLIISDRHGEIDSVLRVNFVHAIILAAIARRDIMVTNCLLEKLIPKDKDGMENEMDEDENDDNENDEDNDDDKPDKPDKPESPEMLKRKFPVDKEILDIAKKIMTGKIK